MRQVYEWCIVLSLQGKVDDSPFVNECGKNWGIWVWYTDNHSDLSQ